MLVLKKKHKILPRCSGEKNIQHSGRILRSVSRAGSFLPVSPEGSGSASLAAGVNESAGKAVQRAKMFPHNVQLWLGDSPLGDSVHRKNLLIQFQKLPASLYLH